MRKGCRLIAGWDVAPRGGAARVRIGICGGWPGRGLPGRVGVQAGGWSGIEQRIGRRDMPSDSRFAEKEGIGEPTEKLTPVGAAHSAQ